MALALRVRTLADTQANCLHVNQVFRDGWECRKCGMAIENEPTDPQDYQSIRFGGLEALKVFREYGMTQKRMTDISLKRYRREHPGKEPIREGERHNYA